MKIKQSIHNYYEFIDGELKLTNINKNVSLKNLEFNFLSNFNNIQCDHKKDVWTFVNNMNKEYKVVLRNVISSGNSDNHHKRIILVPKNFYDPRINVITYYTSSPSKFCFIASSDNDIYNSNILKDNNKINSSIWYNINCIYEALKYDIDIYEEKTRKNNKNYFLYYSTDINKILNQDFSNFAPHNQDIRVDQEFSEINTTTPIINIFENVKWDKKYTLNEEEKNKCQNVDDKFIGKIAEKIFDFYLKNNIDKISNYFNIKINTFEWMNEKKESFLPYDFILNDEIFVDVKGTWKENPYFEFSGNELNFRNSVDEDKYFIFNIYNINEQNEYLFKIYSSDELNNTAFLESTTYIYDERKNNE